jgi:hypothetical protein
MIITKITIPMIAPLDKDLPPEGAGLVAVGPGVGLVVVEPGLMLKLMSCP